jgi:predicted nucleotidyltransferase
MIAPAVECNLEKIKATCEKYRVKSLYLFGSATTKDFTTESDLDFLVEYLKDAEGMQQAAFDYFDLLFSLQDITGKKVDLVVKEAVRNSYFKKSLEEQKVLIYG